MNVATACLITETTADARRATTPEAELTLLRRLEVEVSREIQRVEDRIQLRNRREELVREAARGNGFFV